MGSKLYLQRKIEKVYFYLMITFDVLYTPPPKYHLFARNHLTNVLYNEVKNFELLFRSAAKDPSLCLQIELYFSEIIS